MYDFYTPRFHAFSLNTPTPVLSYWNFLGPGSTILHFLLVLSKEVSP